MESVNQAVQPAQSAQPEVAQPVKAVPTAAVVGEKKSLWKKWWLWVIVAIVVIAVGIYLVV